MPIIPWQCALGDAPPATLPVAATVEIAPPDDSVDTNKIIITGTGTISSFGTDAPLVTKDITFAPVGGSITLVNSAQLALLGAANRTIAAQCFGRFASDGAGHWQEILFSSGAAPLYYSAGTLAQTSGPGTISSGNVASDFVTFSTNHGRQTGSQIQITGPSATTLGLVRYAWYYINAIAANQAALFLTRADAIANTNRVNITGTASSTWAFLTPSGEIATGIYPVAQGGFANNTGSASGGIEFNFINPLIKDSIAFVNEGDLSGASAGTYPAIVYVPRPVAAGAIVLRDPFGAQADWSSAFTLSGPGIAVL